MSLQTAVGPSTLTPGTYLKVNLLAGAGALGAGSLNILLIASKSAAGTLTVDTEVRAGGGESTASTAYGPGTPGHLGAKQIYANDPAALVDFVAPTAGATAATLVLTLSGVPTADNAIQWKIMGRSIQTLWANGTSAAAAAAVAIAGINAKTTDIAVTASGAATLTLTFKVTGKVGNDCLVQATLVNAATGTEAIAGALTPTPLAGGTTDMDVTTALASAAGKEYHFICLVTSNFDATSNSATSNPRRVATAIGNFNSGLNAKLQQCILGCTSAQSAAKTGAINLNNPVFELVNVVNGQSLPGEFAGQETGQRSASDKIDPSANRIGDPIIGNIFCSYQPITDTLTLPQSEDALHNGVTPTSYTASGSPYLVRPITTYSQDANGANDVRCLDVQNVSATYIVARDIRDNLPLAFPNAKISKNFVATSDPPDIPGITEERDIYSWIAARLLQWATVKGVLDYNTTVAVIGAGDPTLGALVVSVDPSDATQVDIVIPWLIVKPLAKFSEVFNRFN